MRSIQRLGDSIRDAWTDAEHSDAGFASLASAALADSELLHSTTKAELNEWFLSGAPLPRQEMRPFGQPALTLYRGDGFYIELLVWLDSTTAIHQHSFAGAFAVYEGSSLHARYRFDCTDAASRELVFGALALRDVEVLRPGDVREINPGPSFVHALFHLERPSLTLVVRTDTLPSWQPQYSYRAPGVGHDPFYDPEPTATQLRLITSLGASQDATFWPIVAAAMRTADPWTTLRLLTVASEVAGDDVRFREVAATARNRHGRRADMMLASLEERARERNIVARRAMAHDPDHRFFLALLLNVGDRPSILDAIQRATPGPIPRRSSCNGSARCPRRNRSASSSMPCR